MALVGLGDPLESDRRRLTLFIHTSDISSTSKRRRRRGALLTQWVTGVDVQTIGLENKRIVEKAFIFRLVWGIEAVRMRRRANGEASEYIEGSAAAALETGLPDTRMAMLVRAGLPSRVAAMNVVHQMRASFANRAEMYVWLRTNEVTAWSGQPDWPTRETADLWKRFRSDAQSGQLQKWFSQSWRFETSLNLEFPSRIVLDPAKP